MTRARSVQFPQQFSEIAIGRLRRRSLEGSAKGRHDPGVSGRNVYLDDSTVEGVQFRRRNVVTFRLHLGGKRLWARGSFVAAGFGPVKSRT